MDTYVVKVRSVTTGKEYELLNVSTTPTKMYQLALLVGPNESDVNQTETFELVVNGTPTGTFTDVIILCRKSLAELINKINAIIDSLWWHTFDHDEYPNIIKLDQDNATLDDIMKAVVELDNSFGWHTFDKVETRIDNLITYEELLILLDDMLGLSMVKFIDGGINRVSQEPIVKGQLIFTRDAKLYWDTPDGERIEMMNEIIEVADMDAFKEIQESEYIYDAFYFIVETGDLYRYSKYNRIGWQHIGATLANENKDGLMPKGLFKKLTELNIDPDEPDADSTDLDVTTSARLWQMLGAPLSSLKSTAKKIISAINELFDTKLGSPDGTDDQKVLLAPVKKGGPARTLPLSDFAYTEGGNTVVPNDVRTVIKADIKNGSAGTNSKYARADHQHPLNVNTAIPSKDGSFNQLNGHTGSSDAYARNDHVHPLNIGTNKTLIKPIDETGALGNSVEYAHANHTHPFGDIGNAILGEISKETATNDIGPSDTLKKALKKLQNKIASNDSRISNIVMDSSTGIVNVSAALAAHTNNNSAHLPNSSKSPATACVLRGDKAFMYLGEIEIGTYPASSDKSSITTADTLALALRKLENRAISNETRTKILEDSITLYCTKGVQTITLNPGTYKVECWGAQGGSLPESLGTNYHGGLGAYVYSTFNVINQINLLAYVGEHPTSFVGGFPYGGSTRLGDYSDGGGCGGGGCTYITPNNVEIFYDAENLRGSSNGSTERNDARYTLGKCITNPVGMKFKLHIPGAVHLNSCIHIWLVRNNSFISATNSTGTSLNKIELVPPNSDDDTEILIECLSSNSFKVTITNPAASLVVTETYTLSSGTFSINDVWTLSMNCISGHNDTYNGISGGWFVYTISDMNNFEFVNANTCTKNCYICAGGGGGASKSANGKNSGNDYATSNTSDGYNGYGVKATDKLRGGGGSGVKGGNAATAETVGGGGGSSFALETTMLSDLTITDGHIQEGVNYGNGKIVITRIS